MALSLPAQQQPLLAYCQVGLSFLEQGMNSVVSRDSIATFFVVFKGHPEEGCPLGKRFVSRVIDPIDKWTENSGGSETSGPWS